MTATKVVLIVLVLIVVLFVVLVVGGSSRNASGPKTDENNFNPNEHSTLAAFNGVLAPFGPKLQAKDLRPPLATFNLSSTPHYQERVLPDSGHKFRQGRFTVQPDNCAHLVYVPSGSNLPDKLKKQQEYTKQSTFTIFEEGGTLTIDRASAGPCEVILQ
jgi:hypothetical protein